MTNLFLRAVILLSVVAAPAAHAQVTVDVSKITCEQFIVLPKADSVAIWLSGYYHGDKHVSTLDVNKFEENARNLRAACRLPDNFKKPIMQLIESTLAEIDTILAPMKKPRSNPGPFVSDGVVAHCTSTISTQFAPLPTG